MTEHRLIRSDPDETGFRIVETHGYTTVGHVFWTPEHQELYVSVTHGGFTNISGGMKLQKAWHWLKSKGIELTHDHRFLLSGYIIACEQAQQACECEACAATGNSCIGHWYKTEAGEWVKR